MTYLAQVVVGVPALASLLAFVLGRRNAMAFTLVAVGSIVSFAGAVALLYGQVASPTSQLLTTVGELPLGAKFSAPLELRVSSAAAVVASVALLVAITVQMFARWYLYSDPRYRSFAATVSLFTSAMMLVVFSNDLLLTLVGWEVMGWCSYLLIGHESSESAARRAAFKAFLITRLADAPFIVGVAILAQGAHSTRITDVVQVWGQGTHSALLTAALLGIICGVLGKSAQLPFSDWLADAMAGPTPASALIHAATMVAAGTVVLVQLNPLLAQSETSRLVLVIVAGSTAVWAAFTAFLQEDVKRLLAWSTVSQVGLMLLAVGVTPPSENPDAALLHLVGHAFFKSLLFLLIGWLSVAVGSTLVTRMSGMVRKLPSTFVPVLAGLFTMAGLPPTVAFVSKDLIVEQAARGQAAGLLPSSIGFVFLLALVVLTAAYSARAWFILQYRTILERRGEQQVLADSHTVRDVGIVEMLRTSPLVDEHGHDLEAYSDEDEDEVLPRPGIVVRLLLWCLVMGSIFGGVLAYSPLLGAPTDHVNVLLMAASFLLVLATGIVVRLMSLRQLHGDAARRLPVRLRLVASRGWGFDALYRRTVAALALTLSRWVRRIDSFWDNGVMGLPHGVAYVGRRLDSVHPRTASSGLPLVIAGVVVAACLGVALW